MPIGRAHKIHCLTDKRIIWLKVLYPRSHLAYKLFGGCYKFQVNGSIVGQGNTLTHRLLTVLTSSEEKLRGTAELLGKGPVKSIEGGALKD